MACRRCGRCCGEYALPIPDKGGLIRFLQWHGADVRHRLDGEYLVYVKAGCIHQSADGACTIHDEPGRPQLCADYFCPAASDGAAGVTPLGSRRPHGRTQVEITRQMLDEREAQLQADMNAIAGALQDVAYFRALLEQNSNDVPDVAQVMDGMGFPCEDVVELEKGAGA